MMEENKKNYKYIIYARKSTEDEGKQVLSIESQIKELTELAETRNLNVINVLSESKSAKQTGRPVFDQLLKAFKKRQADGIIAWKLDRLSRNPRDSAEIDILLQEGTIKHIVTSDKECFPKDNVVMRALEFSMANQYIIDLSNNVKRGNRMKLEKGILPGEAPTGYLNHTDEYGNKSIVRDPKTFDLLKRMWGLALHGEKGTKILDIANNQWGFRTKKRRKTGGRPMSLSYIYKIFTNPFYAGVIRRMHDGEIREYKGIHEPMISLADFEEVQYLLGRKDRPRPKTHEFAYTGLIKCRECGSAITAEEKNKHQKNGNIHQYTYYHCTKRKTDVKCQQKCIEVKMMENQILSYLDRIYISDKFREAAIKYFDEAKGNDEKEIREIIYSQKLTLQKTEESLKRLTDLLIEGTLNKEEYNERKTELQRQQWQLEGKIRQDELHTRQWLEPLKDFIFFLNQAKNWFIFGNTEEKKGILQTISSNLSLINKILIFEAKKPFTFMENELNQHPSVNEALEPTGTYMTTRRNVLLCTNLALLWAQLEEVRTFFVENDGSNFFPPVIKDKIESFIKSL